MARLSKHGKELFRYFSPRRGGLLALMEDGNLLRRTALSGWKIYAKKKPEVALEVWVRNHKDRFAKLPAWAQEIKTLPSWRQLQEWSNDGICETPTGERVEPDGTASDGSPSWLLALGMI